MPALVVYGSATLKGLAPLLRLCSPVGPGWVYFVITVEGTGVTVPFWTNTF